MDLVGQMGGQVNEGLKQVAQSVTIEPLKGLGKVASGVVSQTAETLVTGGQNPAVGQTGNTDQVGQQSSLEAQVSQKDAQELARARQKLAQFNANLERVYQKTEQEEEEKKQVEERQKMEEKQEDGEKKKAQAAALLQAKKGGGTEVGREVK